MKRLVPVNLRLKHFFSLFFLIGHLLVTEGFAQETKTGKDALVNLGPISFSPDYILAEDASFIIFKIRNNTARPIANIFAWIYRFPGGKEGTTDLTLVNNPHKGGVLAKGGIHAPGEVVEWRFPLTGTQKTNPGEAVKYTLRASPKSIFFGDKSFKKTEPPPSRGP